MKFSIDGQEFNVIVTELARKGRVSESKLSGDVKSGAHFRDISFTVHAGEVLGVTGLLGDGRSELFQAVFGDLPYTGQLFMEGQPVKVTSTPQAIRLGIGYVPRNRKASGVLFLLSRRKEIR